MKPCTIEELYEREFLKQISKYGIDIIIQSLEQLGALYYKGEVMNIKKSWAKENLKYYELDFISDRQKEIDGLSDFARSVLGL